MGSKADVTFVAKSEIRNWFFVGFMASLQRTLYVDRKKRSDAKRVSQEMGKRMASGGAVLLFAEGQSDLGTHVLPFRSALIGAAQHAMEEAGATEVLIQPLTIAYTKLQGLPVGRTDRSFIAWIKSKSVKQNLKEILTGGTREVTLAFGTPRPLTAGADRKLLAEADGNGSAPDAGGAQPRHTAAGGGGGSLRAIHQTEVIPSGSAITVYPSASRTTDAPSPSTRARSASRSSTSTSRWIRPCTRPRSISWKHSVGPGPSTITTGSVSGVSPSAASRAISSSS